MKIMKALCAMLLSAMIGCTCVGGTAYAYDGRSYSYNIEVHVNDYYERPWYYSDYVLPGSDYRYYSYGELQSLTTYELFLARNEIYARYGCKFKMIELREHFGSKSWYYPTMPVKKFDDSWLNSYEVENIQTILSIERERNSPYLTTTSYRMYVLPESSERYYSYCELDSLSTYQLFLARNEVFARHGAAFYSQDLREYFGGRHWYHPTLPAGSYGTEILNSVERANVETMLSIERSRNSPYI